MASRIKRLTIVLLLFVSTVFLIGCEKEVITPVYLTKSAVMTPISGASNKLIAIKYYDLSKLSKQVIKVKLSFYKFDQYDFARVIAEGFAYQLQQAGFKTVIVKSDTDIATLQTKPDAILSGKVEHVEFNGGVLLATMNAHGKLADRHSLKATLPEPAEYMTTGEYECSSVRLSTTLGDPQPMFHDVLNRTVTKLVDETCSKPEFANFLTKLCTP